MEQNSKKKNKKKHNNKINSMAFQLHSKGCLPPSIQASQPQHIKQSCISECRLRFIDDQPIIATTQSAHFLTPLLSVSFRASIHQAPSGFCSRSIIRDAQIKCRSRSDNFLLYMMRNN